MGLAYYYNDGGQQTGMFRDYKYLAYGAPCAGMRHEKVLLIPERLDVFTPGNVASRIVVAWVVTLPAAGLIGAAFYEAAALIAR